MQETITYVNRNAHAYAITDADSYQAVTLIEPACLVLH